MVCHGDAYLAFLCSEPLVTICRINTSYAQTTVSSGATSQNPLTSHKHTTPWTLYSGFDVVCG